MQPITPPSCVSQVMQDKTDPERKRGGIFCSRAEESGLVLYGISMSPITENVMQFRSLRPDKFGRYEYPGAYQNVLRNVDDASPKPLNFNLASEEKNNSIVNLNCTHRWRPEKSTAPCVRAIARDDISPPIPLNVREWVGGLLTRGEERKHPATPCTGFPPHNLGRVDHYYCHWITFFKVCIFTTNPANGRKWVRPRLRRGQVGSHERVLETWL